MVIEGLWCQMVRSWPRAVGYAMGVKMVVVLSCLARAYGLFILLIFRRFGLCACGDFYRDEKLVKKFYRRYRWKQ
ncbi:MAG TPA: hypothetical protein DEA94_16910 [Rhodobacteraceae bacterium]|nr:hypothetical protein [Paracoccaceae bacterium]